MRAEMLLAQLEVEAVEEPISSRMAQIKDHFVIYSMAAERCSTAVGLQQRERDSHFYWRG
jgi:hypothetical protein